MIEQGRESEEIFALQSDKIEMYEKKLEEYINRQGL